MEQYYFLYGLALIWIVIAVFQDLRTREISNWLNFSLIVFALGYRGFYSILNNDISFFLLGFVGVLLFTALAYLLYYGRAFAGGDAKLLMGIGGILPFQNAYDYLILGFGFTLLLFGIGAVYSLLYTLILVNRDRKEFVKEFRKEIMKYRTYLTVALIAGAIGFVILFSSSYLYGLLFLVLLIILPLLLVYTRVVEKCYMIKLIDASKLTEGDWLVEDVKLRNNVIRKSVHGLTMKEIELLRKMKKRVLIKEGIPFSPAFLIALVIMVFFVLA